MEPINNFWLDTDIEPSNTWDGLKQQLPSLVDDYLRRGGEIKVFPIGATSEISDVSYPSRYAKEMVQHNTARREASDAKIIAKIDDLLNSGIYKCEMANALRIGISRLNRLLRQHFRHDVRAVPYMRNFE